MSGSAEPGARFETVERLLAFDPGDRKIAALQAPGDLERCCRSLATARSATILTGFFITAAGTAETDGPPGAGDLAAALEAMGIPTTLLTDFNCARVVGAAWDDCLTWDGAGAAPAKAAGASHLIAIERPGRTATGKYYTMRGLDISAQVAPIDRLMLERPAGAITIGVGDGGNEAGMGKAINSVGAHVPNGALIASVVPADFLVAAGTSNWGAWGIAAGLSLLAGRDLLPTAAAARERIERTVAAGAVDGVTRETAATVDGLAWAESEALLARLRGALVAAGIAGEGT